MDTLAIGSAGHAISKSEPNQGFDGSSELVLMRGGGDFRMAVPVKDKSGPEARRSLVDMYGSEVPRKFHSDGSGELKWVCDSSVEFHTQVVMLQLG